MIVILYETLFRYSLYALKIFIFYHFIVHIIVEYESYNFYLQKEVLILQTAQEKAFKSITRLPNNVER